MARRKKRAKMIGPLNEPQAMRKRAKNQKKRARRRAKAGGERRLVPYSGPGHQMVSPNHVVPYYAPELNGSKANQRSQDAGAGDIDQNTKVNVHGLMAPYDAYIRGLHPKVSDNTFRPTFPFTTRYKTTLATVANATAGTNDVYFRVSPMGNGKIAIATAFSGQAYPTSIPTTSDPSYSNWSSFIDEFRQVGCEIKVRATGLLTNLNGAIAIGRVGNADAPDASHTTWGALAESGDITTHTGGKPGDVFKAIFMPLPSDVTHDWNFAAPSAVAGTEDTNLIFWFQGISGTVMNFDVEVYTHYEALVTAGQDQIYQPTTTVADASKSSQLVARCISTLPLCDQIRAVETDDGEIMSAISDVKAIWGAGKRLYAGAQKAWSFFKGLFVRRPGEEGLLAAIDNGLTLAMLDEWKAIILKVGAPDEKALQLVLAEKAEKRRKRLAFERVTGLTAADARALIADDSYVTVSQDEKTNTPAPRRGVQLTVR
jgi:hypothetical protein